MSSTCCPWASRSLPPGWFTTPPARNRTLDQALACELRNLYTQGNHIGLLTNSVREWEPHRQRILGTTDYLLRSHEAGLAKPDTAIYALADTLLGTPESMKILIDDSPANCHAATAHGWTVIHHTQTGDTIGALRAIIGR